MLSEGAGVVLHEDTDAMLRPWRTDIAPVVIDGSTLRAPSV